ncbi:acylphosphatase-2 isoform X2 [Eretmochelys imbricata]
MPRCSGSAGAGAFSQLPAPGLGRELRARHRLSPARGRFSKKLEPRALPSGPRQPSPGGEGGAPRLRRSRALPQRVGAGRLPRLHPAMSALAKASGALKSVDYEVFGRVQGVCFRMYTEDEARKMGVVGWVKNTRQGTVTGQVQGPEDKVNAISCIFHCVSECLPAG